MTRQSLRTRLNTLLKSKPSTEQFCREAVRLIQEYKPYYDWVGIYRFANDELVLPPDWFVGLEPEHQRISLDSGICGAAASDRETIVVDDVRTDSRYLACSIATRSEIVVPIQWQGHLYGVLDLDSDTLAAFGTDDVSALQDAAQILAHHFSDNEEN